MTPALSLRRAFFALIAAPFALAGCDVMETQRVSLTPEAYETAGLRCESTLGSYALPKAFIHVRLEQSGSAPPELHPWGTAKAPVLVELHPDHTQVYCLDHLNSPTAADDVKVLKYPGDREKGQKNYLEWVLVNTTDQTAVIAQALIKAAFIVASGAPSDSLRETAQPPRTILDLEYDPFDAAASAEANRALTDRGFCLVLENYTAGSDLPHEEYCRHPGRYGARSTEFARVYKDYERRPADPKVAGIVYRPRQSYRLSIYRKFDPKGGEDWRLQQMLSVDLENLSPVFRLDLTRAIFAGKQAHFKFDRGALIHSCISKASEIEGFVSIPLQVSKSLVDLPTQIFQVQINQVTRDTELVRAQERVLLAQRAILQAMISGKYTAINPAAASPPIAAFSAKEIDLNLGIEAIEAQGLIAARPGPQFAAKPGECEPEAAQ